MWTIALPLRVPLPRKKKEKFWSLNLNLYRNAHPQTLNQAKVSFDEIAELLIRKAGIPRLARCTLEYTLFPGSAQLCDTNNVCSVADKFFSDSLVNAGILEDDNYNFIVSSTFKFGAIDREDPRIEVAVRSADHVSAAPEGRQESQRTMKITTTTTAHLTEAEVHQALREFMGKHATIAPDAKVSMKENKDGSYAIEIEQEHGASAEGKKAPRTKLEPAAAMAALSKATSEAAPTPDTQTLPMFEKADLGAAAAPQTAPATAPTQEVAPAAQASPEPAQEAAPAAPVKSLFATFTRPKN